MRARTVVVVSCVWCVRASINAALALVMLAAMRTRNANIHVHAVHTRVRGTRAMAISCRD